MGAITSEEFVPIGPSSPRFTRRSNDCWLVDVGESVVALGESVLDTLEGTEVISLPTVLRISVSLPPGLVEDRQSAIVLRSDSIYKCEGVWQGVVVNHIFWEAGSLALILQDHHVPVSVVNMSEAVGSVPFKVNSPRCLAVIVNSITSVLGKTRDHMTERTGVAVTKEQNPLIFLAELFLARVREANTLVRTGWLIWVLLNSWTILTAVREMIGTKYRTAVSI